MKARSGTRGFPKVVEAQEEIDWTENPRSPMEISSERKASWFDPDFVRAVRSVSMSIVSRVGGNDGSSSITRANAPLLGRLHLYLCTYERRSPANVPAFVCPVDRWTVGAQSAHSSPPHNALLRHSCCTVRALLARPTSSIRLHSKHPRQPLHLLREKRWRRRRCPAGGTTGLGRPRGVHQASKFAQRGPLGSRLEGGGRG